MLFLSRYVTRHPIAALTVEHFNSQAALACRDSVLGDPASWLRCTQEADAVKVATRARGARAVIIIVQPASSSDIPDERALQLCKQAGIDRR